jgi:hypothetical protein
MTRFKILGAAAMLSMITATPLFAQAAIQEPGAYAFYHPNGGVRETGRTWSAETAGAMVPYGSRGAYASMDARASTSSCARRYRSWDPASGTFLGRDGNRHRCK